MVIPGAPLSLSTLRVGAILNTSSGSCDESSEEKLLSILQENAIADVRIWCGGADQVEQAFAEAATHKLDVLIVLGGDGTIRTAAEACGMNTPYLIPLPGGTMNMLPKALYGEMSWEDALCATLASPKTKRISGGGVNGKQFFIASIVGAPALWADVRESVRAGDVGAAIGQSTTALQHMFAANIQYEFSDTTHGETEALTILCPLISEVLPDTESAFEAAVIDIHNAFELLGLASTAAFGKWRDDSHIHTTKTKLIRVHSNTSVPVIIDGESVEVGKDIEFSFVPHAFTALVPTE